jgi:hypothetical protein
VIIAGSAGLSTRRACQTARHDPGAVGGVTIAAFVPDNLLGLSPSSRWVCSSPSSAAASYPAMVFWMSIAFVPLFATEGQYLI